MLVQTFTPLSRHFSDTYIASSTHGTKSRGLQALSFALLTGRGGGVKLLRVSDELSQHRQCSCSDRNSCGGKVVPWGPANVDVTHWDDFPHCLLLI